MSFMDQSADVDADGATTQDDDDISVADQSSVSVELDKATVDEESVTARAKVVRNVPERGKKRRGSDLSDREMLQAILQCGTNSSSNVEQQVSDEFYRFGMSVAQTLRRLGGRQQAWVKVKITELLYKAEFRESTAGRPSFQQVGGLRQTETTGFERGDQTAAGVLWSASDSVLTVQGTDSTAAWDISSPSLLAQAMADSGIPVNLNDDI